MTTEPRPLQSVWCLGSGSMFCMDVFATKKQAADKFIGYMNDEDNHWIGKMSEWNQKLFRFLMTGYENGTLTIEELVSEYNRLAPDDAKWHLKEEDVIYE